MRCLIVIDDKSVAPGAKELAKNFSKKYNTTVAYMRVAVRYADDMDFERVHFEYSTISNKGLRAARRICEEQPSAFVSASIY